MNHDIKHCNAHGCIKAYTCHRYIAHMDAREKELHWLPYLHPVECIDNDYKDYWKEGNDEKIQDN